MADLFSKKERDAIIKRLQALTPDARPRWGSMTAPRLLAHIIDTFQVTFAEKEVTVEKGFLSTALGRWLVLRLPIPRNVKAPPSMFESEAGHFDEDRERIITYINRFADGPNQQWGPSPLFGKMSPKQWASLHRTHLRHHLKQFGV